MITDPHSRPAMTPERVTPTELRAHVRAIIRQAEQAAELRAWTASYAGSWICCAGRRMPAWDACPNCQTPGPQPRKAKP